MEIRQLQYFISAAKHLNFTRAAEECCIVQTAMTHQIAALEKELGVKLFLRDRRRVILTPIGEAFLKEAKRIVAQVQNTVDEVNAMSAGHAASLTLGYCGSTLRPQLPQLLARFHALHPDVRVMLRQGTLAEMTSMLESGALDVVFSIQYDYLALYDWIEVRKLFEDHTCLVVHRSHPLAQQKSVTLSDISQIPMVIYTEKGSQEKFADCASRGFPLNVVAEITETDCAQILLESGYYASICISHMQHKYNPQIKGVPVTDDASSDVVALINKRRTNKYLNAFLDLTEKYDFVKQAWKDDYQSE